VKQRKEDSHDEFMRLTDHEIAGCINDIGVPFSSDDLQRPQAQQIQKVFEWFAELLMNTTRETVEPAMREAARDVCGDELLDIVPAETRNLMGFYASLRKLLVEVGIHDFSFSDLLRPTHGRLVKIFSYIINFVRFRETQTATIDKHFNLLAGTKSRIEMLHSGNDKLRLRLDDLQAQRASLKAAAQKHEAGNEELKNRLITLQREQGQRTVELEKLKAEKTSLAGVLEDRTAKHVSVSQEADKLRPYANASGKGLSDELTDLHAGLAKDKAALAGAEKRLRALNTSADTFQLVAADVQPCVGLLASLANDLQAEEAEASEASRHKDALTERSSNVRDIERQEKQLGDHLRQWAKRTETLRRTADERSEAAGRRMRELGDEHRRLAGERGEKGREVERRKVRVEQTEKKVCGGTAFLSLKN